MTLFGKPCSCAGTNANCVRCSGTGSIRPHHPQPRLVLRSLQRPIFGDEKSVVQSPRHALHPLWMRQAAVAVAVSPSIIWAAALITVDWVPGEARVLLTGLIALVAACAWVVWPEDNASVSSREPSLEPPPDGLRCDRLREMPCSPTLH
jgi:hypothetical protein